MFDDRKRVLLYVFNDSTGIIDKRRKFLEDSRAKPDFIAAGRPRHCGKEIAHKLYLLGFSSIADFFAYAFKFNFEEAGREAEKVNLQVNGAVESLKQIKEDAEKEAFIPIKT